MGLHRIRNEVIKRINVNVLAEYMVYMLGYYLRKVPMGCLLIGTCFYRLFAGEMYPYARNSYWKRRLMRLHADCTTV